MSIWCLFLIWSELTLLLRTGRCETKGWQIQLELPALDLFLVVSCGKMHPEQVASEL